MFFVLKLKINNSRLEFFTKFLDLFDMIQFTKYYGS